MRNVVKASDNFSEIRKSLKGLKGSNVGYLRNTTGNQKPYESDLNLATNAMIHEFGSKERKIPTRPFMRKGVKRFERSKRKIARSLKMAITKELSPNSVDQRIGALMQSKIQEAIREDKFRALKPSTISAKGSSKPLIDDGHLIQGVDSEPKQ